MKTKFEVGDLILNAKLELKHIVSILITKREITYLLDTKDSICCGMTEKEMGDDYIQALELALVEHIGNIDRQRDRT